MYSISCGLFSIEQDPVPRRNGDNASLYSIVLFAVQEGFVEFGNIGYLYIQADAFTIIPRPCATH